MPRSDVYACPCRLLYENPPVWLKLAGRLGLPFVAGRYPDGAAPFM